MDGDAPSIGPLAVPGDEPMDDDVLWDETATTQPLDSQYITITNGGVRLHEYSSDSTHFLCVCGAFVGCLISDGDDSMDTGEVSTAAAAAAAAPTAPSEEEMRAAVFEQHRITKTPSLEEQANDLPLEDFTALLKHMVQVRDKKALAAAELKKSQAVVLANSKKAAEAQKQATLAKPHNAAAELMAATATRTRRSATTARITAGRH